MLAYLIASSVVFLFFFAIWKTEDWFNTCLKFFLLCLAIVGIILSLIQLGFITRAG